MGVRVRVDERGRITLPKEVRTALNIAPGDELTLSVVGNRIVLEKSTDPFEKLARLLGSLSFDRRLRAEAEQEAMRSATERLGSHGKEVSPGNRFSTGA